MSLWTTLLGCAQNLQWEVLQRQIRSTYPTVTHLSPDSLHQRLQAGEPTVLLDVRTAEEYAVSHLPSARHVRPDAEVADLAFLDDLPRDTPIVAYCSVGYRSSDLAARLQAAGFTRVVNLEGSLFAWANAGLPLYRDSVAVQEAHPYNALWGRLLDKKYHAYTPSGQE